MAIAYDTSSIGSNDGTNATSISWSHTCTGDKPILLVGVARQGSGTVTSITYNGVAMVLINTQNISGSAFGNMYFYRNDTTQTLVSGTAYTIAITINTASYLYCAATSYTGVDPTSPINASGTTVGTNTSITGTITTTVKNTWLVGYLMNDTPYPVSNSGSGTIKRVTNYNISNLYDSNGKRAIGSNSIIATTNTSVKHGFNVAALTPYLYTYPIWTDLNHYWKLDEITGTSMADAIGGVALTAGGTINQTGKNNKGVYCIAASNNLYTSTEINNFEKTDSFSFSFWAKRVDAGAFFRGYISRVSRASGILGYNIDVNTNNTIYIEMFGGGTSNWIQANSTTTVPTDTTTFHHYVFTYDGSQNSSGINVYIDGTPVSWGSATNSLAGGATMKVTSATFRVGEYEGSNQSKSIIDEFGSWTRELSDTDVATLYNSGAGLFYSAPSTVNARFFTFFNC